MFTLLLLVSGAEPPAFVVENKVPPFVVVNRIVPPPARSDVPTDLDKPTPAGWEKVKIGDGPWHFRKIAAPGVAAPIFPSGGCGCSAGANCGAAFCKSHGGPGCPASCPVKK